MQLLKIQCSQIQHNCLLARHTTDGLSKTEVSYCTGFRQICGLQADGEFERVC